MGMFSSMPKTAPATPVAPAPPPVVTDASGQAQDQADALRRRRGAAASVLTTPDTTAAPTTGAKMLLGS